MQAVSNATSIGIWDRRIGTPLQLYSLHYSLASFHRCLFNSFNRDWLNGDDRGIVSIEMGRKERLFMRQRRQACFQETSTEGQGSDMFVDLTIYDVPTRLLEEFGKKVVRSRYPSGVNEAIKNLLRKAILEQLDPDAGVQIRT